MSFIPINFMRPVEEMSKDFTRTAVRIINGVEQLPFSSFDLTIDDRYFSEMEITPSPHMSMGYRVLLEDLVEKYNPSAKIKESSLKGLI